MLAPAFMGVPSVSEKSPLTGSLKGGLSRCSAMPSTTIVGSILGLMSPPKA